MPPPAIDSISDKSWDALWNAGIVALTGLLSYIGLRLKSKKVINQPSVDAILDSGEIIGIIDEMVTTLGADKGLLLFTSNGGGIPSAGKITYVTMLFECIHSRILGTSRSAFQNIPCDTGYIKMLNRILAEGYLAGDAATLDDGFLKDLYVTEKVSHFAIFPVIQTKMRFYYLSVRWYEGDVIPDCPAIRTACLAAVGQIANILRRQPK